MLPNAAASVFSQGGSDEFKDGLQGWLLPLAEHAEVLAEEFDGGYAGRVRGTVALALGFDFEAFQDPLLRYLGTPATVGTRGLDGCLNF